MTTTTTTASQHTSVVASRPKEQTISFIPLGEQEEIHLTLSRVKQFLCIPTKSGKLPTDEQVMKFIMLSKAQSLNPWTNDCFLCGYDGKDGPQFSLITAHSAMLKRAEASPEFDGMESGVVVARGDAITERQGDLLLNGEVLVGAWARVHRRDRNIASYDSLNLSTFNTGRSRWATDPAGMIVKCAESSALRKAFPSTLAAMYCKEEMDRLRDQHESSQAAEAKPKQDALAERLAAQKTARITQESQPSPSFTVATEGASHQTTSAVADLEPQSDERGESESDGDQPLNKSEKSGAFSEFLYDLQDARSVQEADVMLAKLRGSKGTTKNELSVAMAAFDARIGDLGNSAQK